MHRLRNEQGGNLTQMICRQMASPVTRLYSDHDAWRWLLDLARGLAFLHSREPAIIHRDVKVRGEA